MSEEGVSEERRQRARLEHSEDSFAPPPMPKEGTKPLTMPPQLAPVVTRVDATTWALNSKTLTLIGSVLLVAVFGLVILTRPSCLFADPGKQVSGQFSSKHLGVAWVFPEPWLHAEDLDDDEDLEGGWERRASVFYRGRSAADYQSQLVVVTFARDKTKVTEDDARQLGANEVVGAASMRQCAPFDLRGVKGTRCGAMTVRGTRPMGLLELYFPMTEHAVFLRYTFEANLPTPSQDMREMETQSRMNEEAMADRIRQTLEIVSSIRELNQK